MENVQPPLLQFAVKCFGLGRECQQAQQQSLVAGAAALLEQRQRLLPEPAALHLTRRADLLELDLPEPDLGLYGPHDAGPAQGATHE